MTYWQAVLFLVLLFVVADALCGIHRQLRRIADKLEGEP